MLAWNHPSRPGHSLVAWGLYVCAVLALVGFLFVPYNEIWIYPGWDEDFGSTGLQLMEQAWRAAFQVGPFPTEFTVSVSFGILTAFSVLCVLPAAALLWLGGYSRLILWLGRIWWTLLILPGFAWFFLLENALRTPGTIEYQHQEGMILYWVGGLGVAVAFWMTGRRDESMECRVRMSE